MGRVSRWLFERRLARSATLQRELETLDSLGCWARDLDENLGATPDLWDGIALRLPAEDARRADDLAASAPTGVGAPWIRPFGAAAATAAVVLAVAIGVLSRDTAPAGVVRWMDSGRRSVMVLEDGADTTIIWLLDDRVDDRVPGDLSKGGMREVV